MDDRWFRLGDHGRYLNLMLYKLWKARLGEYDSQMAHGTATRNVHGQLSLRRIGPYIPPLTFAQAWIVTDQLRCSLLESQLGDFQFARVVKEHIVTNVWTPDQNLRENSLPRDSDDQSKDLHDQNTSDELGDLWELEVPENSNLRVVEDSHGAPVSLDFDPTRELDSQIFRPAKYGGTYVTETAKGWLEEMADPRVLDFRPIRSSERT